MHDELPQSRPNTPLLDAIETPRQLRQLERSQLSKLAAELRAFLLYSVGRSGGHFGAGLGVVELTIALHYLLDTPNDRLVWDVGHQCYPHKILCGRREAMATIRQHGGIAGFPKRSESDYDAFGVGHAGTSLGALMGMAEAARLRGESRRHVAVIGDGAMTAGMAFEAINHIAHQGSDVLVILNDNHMSISPNVGGLASYFSRIWEGETYHPKRERGQSDDGETEDGGPFFRALGLHYRGPVDGHNLPALLDAMTSMLKLSGPRLLHVRTRKGQGFVPAERDPVTYHALAKIEPKEKNTATGKAKRYQDIFGEWLCATAAQDPRLVGITPAMCEGSGMVKFAENFAGRFYDVAIAEQHALSFAAGLACEDVKPVVAIYSTFLQRGYDQLIHDIALQKLDVTLAIDRAGLVGEDGPTHHGSFDLSFLLCVPNLIVATPSDENACWQLLHAAYQHDGPAAVRYPRGSGPGMAIVNEPTQWQVGHGHEIHAGKQTALLNFGALLPEVQKVANKCNYALFDMRWAKPLDHGLIIEAALQYEYLVTVEENTLAGGAGSAVREYLATQGLKNSLLTLGLPDRFIDHGPRATLLAQVGLDAQGIEHNIESWLATVKP